MKVSKEDHKALVRWSADCAEHVLWLFEQEHPKDDRPRKAIEEARKWAKGNKPMKMSVIRTASLDAHAAARAATKPAAIAAARAAGQAVATVHVFTHFPGAAMYGIKAADAAGIKGEREWQAKRFSRVIPEKPFRSLKT